MSLPGARLFHVEHVITLSVGVNFISLAKTGQSGILDIGAECQGCK